jgi:GR25 family glycosyltransferase involved in LPS biosynthesis
MKIYAISLKQQMDRQTVLKEYFKDVEIVDAIDKVNIKRTSDLKNGEIACFLSHMKVWKMVSQQDHNDWVLVLEDDAKPKKDWKVKLDEGLKQIPNNFGIVYLGGGRKDTMKRIIERRKLDINKFKFHENKSLGKYTEVCNPVLQTHAYMIKPSTAKHLLNSIKTIELPIDIQWWLYGIDFARFKKALIVQNRIFNSNIQ